MKPYATSGPMRSRTSKTNVAWAERLARVMREMPDDVSIFVRSGCGNVTLQVLDGTPDDNAGGLDLDAMSIIDITIEGGDCGDP